MCTSEYIVYVCGCKREMEFVQCKGRQGTNVRCHSIKQVKGKDATNLCLSHLVKPSAPVTYGRPTFNVPPSDDEGG